MIAVAGPAHSILNSGFVQVVGTIVGGLLLAGFLYLIKLAHAGADAARRARNAAASAANAAGDARIAAGMNAYSQHETEQTLNEVARKVSTPAEGTIGDVVAQTKDLVAEHVAVDDRRFQEIWDFFGIPAPVER